VGGRPGGMIQVLMPVVQACTTLSSNPSTAKNNNKKIYLIYHNARNANAHTHIILYYIILYYVVLYYVKISYSTHGINKIGE
jgi:hypothetical protein